MPNPDALHATTRQAASARQGIVAAGYCGQAGTADLIPAIQESVCHALGPVISGIVGVDEAGRGPLAGPVYAAAVMLNPQDEILGLADSKTLTAARRETLAEQIRRRALAWCIALADVREIDTLNILHATLLAMRRACAGLPAHITLARIDGNRVPRDLPFPAESLVKGDATVPAIAAASILAKTARDAWCQQLHAAYPQYAFDQHKGYGTALHLARLRMYGPCPEHRTSFAPVRRCLADVTLAADVPAAVDAPRPGISHDAVVADPAN